MTMAKHVNCSTASQPNRAFKETQTLGKLARLIVVALGLSSPAFADETTIVFAKDESFLECIGFVKDNPGELHIFDLEPWQEVSAHCDKSKKIFHYQADEYGHLEVYVPIGGIKIGMWRSSIDDPWEGPECQSAREAMGFQ
jgi:hypothetical protein